MACQAVAVAKGESCTASVACHRRDCNKRSSGHRGKPEGFSLASDNVQTDRFPARDLEGGDGEGEGRYVQEGGLRRKMKRNDRILVVSSEMGHDGGVCKRKDGVSLFAGPYVVRRRRRAEEASGDEPSGPDSFEV